MCVGSHNIMDLDIKGMQESMEQLKLSEKPRLSMKAKQRISIKSKKQALTASKSSPLTERKEGKRTTAASNTRSVSPPATHARNTNDSGILCEYLCH